MEKYLIRYLLEHEKDPLRAKYIEYFKTEMDWFIYNYGDHISKTHQKKQPSNLMGYLYRYLQYLGSLQTRPIFDKKINVLTKFTIPELDDICRFYSSILTPCGRSNVIGDIKSILFKEKKQRVINNGCIWDFLEPSFIELIEELKITIIKQIEEYKLRALFLHTDQYFEAKLLLDIFHHIKLPTFIFVHGLPGAYTLDVYNRSDYLMVWGERMKDNYIKAGFNKNKIIVVGNRNYPNFSSKLVLRNSLDDVLVIPPSAAQWHQDTWGTPDLIDRSAAILYLSQIETVLNKIGIKHARYRLHPSIDKKWTDSFLDHDFFEIDTLPLTPSLNKATIVIGSASSVLFDAVAHGVNYILFEPQENGKSLLGTNIIPPFDGSDGFVTAKNEIELEAVLRELPLVPESGIKAFMEPFDVSPIKKLID